MQAIVNCVLFSSLSLCSYWIGVIARVPNDTVYGNGSAKNPISQRKRMASKRPSECERIARRHKQIHTRCARCAFGKWKWRWFVCILPSARVYASCCCFDDGGDCGWGRPIEIENFSFMQSHRFSLSVWTIEAEVSSHRYRHSVRCTYFLSK